MQKRARLTARRRCIGPFTTMMSSSLRGLLAAGADPNVANDYGATPLGEAAVAANTAVIEKLLAAGADANGIGKDGETPLMVLARSSNVEAARLLIQGGADVNAAEAWRGQTALIWAAAQKQPAMVKLLVDSGADPNARSKPNDWDRQVSGEKRRQYRPFGGLTALMYAAREGCADCARALVEGGADIDLAGSRNITPLIMALENMNFDTAAYLLEAGAAVDVWDWWGRTPLYMAVDLNTVPHGGRPDRLSTDATPAIVLVERILERGANPNVAAQAAAAVSGARQRPRLRLDARDRCDTAAARGQDVRYRGHEAADRARRAARPAQLERRHADHGGCRLRLARVRHPRSRTRNSALRDERRRAEVGRGFASAGRRRRRCERGDHGRRTR